MKIGPQFLKFGLVGGLNTGIQYGVWWLLFRLLGVPMLVASGLGYTAGIVNSYFLNRSWTFKAAGNRNAGEFGKFVVVNLVAMGMNLLALKFLVDGARLKPEIAQVLAIGASLVVNFAGNRIWTFREKTGESA